MKVKVSRKQTIVGHVNSGLLFWVLRYGKGIGCCYSGCKGKVLVKSQPTSLSPDWRDRSYLKLFGEWPGCWLTLASR